MRETRGGLRALDDLEAFSDGAPLARELASLRPRSLTIDLGSSSLGRAVAALAAVEAVLTTFPEASLQVVALSPARELLEEHLRARGRSLSASGELVIDLVPGVRHSAALVDDGGVPRLRVPAAPYGHRLQHAFAHFADGAAVAGLSPDWRRPELALEARTRSAARSIVRAQHGLGKPLVAALRSNADSFDFRGVLVMLRERIGAEELVLAEELPAPIRAAALALVAVAVGSPGDWSAVAAAVGAPVVTVHGRACPVRHGPASERGTAVYRRCRVPALHGAQASRELRCVRCVPPTLVASAAEQLSAERWPVDRLVRFLP